MIPDAAAIHAPEVPSSANVHQNLLGKTHILSIIQRWKGLLPQYLEFLMKLKQAKDPFWQVPEVQVLYSK
jgi:hypothetical protein